MLFSCAAALLFGYDSKTGVSLVVVPWIGSLLAACDKAGPGRLEAGGGALLQGPSGYKSPTCCAAAAAPPLPGKNAPPLDGDQAGVNCNVA